MKKLVSVFALMFFFASIAMAAITHARLALCSVLATTGAVVSATGKTYIKALILHNIKNSVEICTIYLIPSGGSADNKYRLYQLSIPANDTVHLEPSGAGIVLENGEALHARTTTDSGVNVAVFGATE